MRSSPRLRRLLALLTIALVGALPRASVAQPPAQEPVGRYRITSVVTREQRGAIAATGAAIDAVGPDWVDITATSKNLRQIAGLGFVVTRLAGPRDAQHIDPAYHTYDEMVAEIAQVAAAHPAIVKLFDIGRSYRGRTLWAAKISDHVTADEDEPEALFVGHYHAREHLTVEMMLDILHLLADNYGMADQEEVTQLVDSREIFLIFDLNPDGGEYDIQCEDPQAIECDNPDYGYLYWRKNRQPNDDGSIGTDPNRNHSYRWGGIGASDYTADETYRGAAPASAPEVAAIEAFVNGRVLAGVQQISVAITFHTYGKLVLWPYGYTYEDVPEDMRPDDHAVLVAMGQAMAASNGYTPQQASDLYPTSGDFTDWAYGVHRIFAYTFEMDDGAYGFYPPGTMITETTTINRPAVLYLLAHAGCPYEVINKAAEHCTNGRVDPPKRFWLPFISL
jgi:carboxypeptidase T